jgi:outer membrane protein assembly factor BamB
MAVIAEGAAQSVLAIEPPKMSGGQPRLIWQRPGRGMNDGGRSLGPLAADLDGDGGCEIVVADQTPAGEALLIAYRHDGSRMWQRCFEQTGGHPPVWNISALTFWWPGHFRDTKQLDLFVNHRRGLMHSDVGQLLDGRTGAIVWTQEKAVVSGEFHWGYAGIPPGIADVNADGLDELISLYPVCFWIAEGKTGRITVGKDLAGRKAFPAWAAYGEPMIQDFTGDGKADILLDSPYILGLMDTAGAPIWHGLGRADFPTTASQGNANENTSIRHALVDLDGDGRCEIASGGYGDQVRAIDPRDGKLLWSLAAPQPTGQRVAAANIDGLRGDEILYPAGDTLVVVTGDRSAGRVLWKWQGPAALSMPAIADTDGDGQAEVVVQAADGSIHCLDSAP